MKITVIGAGAIGGNLAKLLSDAGHDVLVADARGPEVVPAEALDAGARAVELDGSTTGREVVVLSVPFSVQPQLAKLVAAAPDDAVVVDTANYYPQLTGPHEAADSGQVESLWVQEQLGRPIAKAWNAALAETQRTQGCPVGSPDRVALPVAADSDEARRTVMALVDDTGFDPFDAGELAESWRQQPGTPAYCTELALDELGAALAAADKEAAPVNRDRLMAMYANLTEPLNREEVVARNRAGTRPSMPPTA